MRSAVVRKYFCLCIFLLLASQCLAQTSSPVLPSDSSKRKTTVYLPGFSTLNASTDADKNLGKFVDRLLSYRFSELPKLQVAMAGRDPTCGQELRQTRSFVAQSPVSSQGEDSGPVYLVQGSLEFHPAGENELMRIGQTALSADLVLNYQLVKSLNCNQQSLMGRSEPISRARLIESLTVMADAMALRLAEEINRRTRIDVIPIAANQAGPDEQQFASALTDSLVQVLAQSEDFEPNDLRQPSPGTPAAYTLEGSVRFVHSPNLFKRFGAEAIITLHLRIGDHTEKAADSSPFYSLTRSPIRGPLSQRADLLASASAAAVKGVSEVRDARDAGLPEKLSELKLDDLLNRAKDALCDGMDTSCTPKPEAALLLLQQAAKEEDPGDSRAQEWTGRALYLSGKFVDSAKKYDGVVASLPSSSAEDRLRLLIFSGDSWYRAQSFVNAANRYDEAANLLQSHPDLSTRADINIRRSLSHRFRGDRLGALDALLIPVGKLPAASTLQRELKHAVDSLTEADIPEAVARLEALPDQPERRAILVDAYLKQFDVLSRHGQYWDAENIVRKALNAGVPERTAELNYSLALAHFLGTRDSSTSPEQKAAEFRFSSDLLWNILEKDPSAQSFNPFQLRLLICADYLDDRDCARNTIALLDRISPDSVPIPLGIQMDLTEFEFLNGSLDSAAARLNRALKETELDPPLKTVAYFYEVWISMSQGDNKRSGQAFSHWEDCLKGLRKNGTDINWVFGAAGRSLHAQEARITDRRRDLLTKMIRAMEDPNQPIPRFQL